MYTIWYHIELVVGIIVLLYMIREVYFPKKKKIVPLPVDWKHEFKLGPHVAELSDAEYWAAWEEAIREEQVNQ